MGAHILSRLQRHCHPDDGVARPHLRRKRYLTFSVLLFTFASLLCGSSTSLGMLVFFRVLQGIGGGALQPMSQAILLETFPPKEHGMAMAIFGIGAMFGPHRRPADGRVHHGHPLLAVDLLRQHPDRALRRLHGFDVHPRPAVPQASQGRESRRLGIALLTVWVGALQIVVDKGQREDWFHSDFILVLSAVAALALLLFVIVELFVAEHPVVDLRAFGNISFTTGNVVMFVAFFNLLGSIVLLPLYAQLLLGYTATLAGLVLSPEESPRSSRCRWWGGSSGGTTRSTRSSSGSRCAPSPPGRCRTSP